MTFARHARLRRLAPYVLVGSIGVFLFYVATQFEFHRRSGVLGPDFWPKLVLGLLITVCACEIARIVFSKNPDRDVGGALDDITDGGTDTDTPETATRHPWRLAAGMAATLAYVALVGTTGFFLTTATYLAAFLIIGGYRNRNMIVALSLGGALLLMFIFMKLVYVSLPIGSEPYARVTLLLMQLMGIR